MAKRRQAICRLCGGHRDDVGPISFNGRCSACGETNMAENARQINAKAGPFHDRRMDGYRRMLDNMSA